MRSSRTITLFSVQPETKRGPSAFVASVTVHSSAIGLIGLALMIAPQFRLHTPDVYMMQHVNLNVPEELIHRAGGSGGMYPSSSSAGNETSTHEKLAAPASSRLQVKLRKITPQTLIEPDVPLDKMLPKETPVPAMMLWSGKQPKIKMLTPPPPQPAVAFAKPKLSFPNKEVQLSDLNMASTSFQSKVPMPAPSNTSPIVVRQEAPAPRVQQTTSVSTSQPTPAAVLSASDLHMAQGNVSLPAANQSALGHEEGGLGTGRSAPSTQSGNGDSGSTGTERGDGKGHGSSGGQTAGNGSGAGKQGTGNGTSANGNGNGSGQGQGHDFGNGSGAKENAGTGSGAGGEGSVARITLPKNGQFGVVVVGSTMDEQFPETTEIWKGRLAYSVYLHVGMEKSWILQYSVPRSVDSANAGSARLEAPWPFYIVRPNLDANLAESDSVMVHGFVNEAGQFESLAVVFPSDFPQEQLVLNALRQWKFRPGTQNGQIAKLEVLVIIPEVTE